MIAGFLRGKLGMKKLAAAIAISVVPVAAYAGPKPYPYKAGVAAETLEAEQGECLAAASVAFKNPGAPNPYNPVTQGTVAGATGAAAANGFARGIEQGRAYKVTYLSCMKSKGYIHLGLPSADWKQIKKLPKSEMNTRLLALQSSPTPQHPIVPEDEMD